MAPYDARQIANWFILRAKKDNKRLSVVHILKLCYLAHGWYMVSYDGDPLFRNRVEAWPYGPVISDIYDKFRGKGMWTRDIIPEFGLPESDAEDLLQIIYRDYGGLSAGQLSFLTHEEDGPWGIGTRMNEPFGEIPNEVIYEHYAEMQRCYAAEESK